jgi:hypothetical protein
MSDSAFPFTQDERPSGRSPAPPSPTHEMVVVHKLFRREFTQGPGWVRCVAPVDTKRRSWSTPK